MAVQMKWYGNGFASKTISNLPRVISLRGKKGLKEYHVDYADAGDERACREVVMESRAGGDNVGLGEYTDDEEFLYMLGLSEVFKVLDDRETIRAFFVVQPCMLSRSWGCCLASIHIFRASELQYNLELYRHLLRLGVQFTRQLDAGYTRCVVSVAAALHDMTRVVREEGFVIVATLPEGVNLARLGVCEDLVMVNSLGLPTPPRRSDKELSNVVENFLTLLKLMPSYDGDWSKLSIPCLPQTYIFSNGLRTTVRMMEARDVEECYAVFARAIKKGHGYGLDDCPTLDIFYQTKLRGGYSIVVTTEDSEQLAQTSSSKKTSGAGSKLVSFTLLGDSWYSRNPDARHGESSIVITEEFRGQGLAREMIAMELSLLKELGYRGMLNDALLSNSRMLQSLQGNEFPSVIVGVIPDGTLTAGYGWDDQVIDFTDFGAAGNTVKTFTEMAKLSRMRDERDVKMIKNSKL